MTRDQPNEMFGGKSPRVAYSAFTKYVNEAMGRTAMGDWVVQRLRYYRGLQEKRGTLQRVQGVIIFDDAPTPSYNTIVQYLGAENCTQVVVSRDGCSSMPVDLPKDVRICAVRNPGDSVAAFESAIRRAAPHLFIALATAEDLK